VAQIYVGDAALAGFRLIGRQPLAVVGWAVFIFVGAMLPFGLMLSVIGPEYLAFFQAAAAQGAAGPPMAALAAFQQKMQALVLLNPLIFVASMAVRSMLVCAVLRAVLEPQKSAWAYLRLGTQELWVALATLVGAIILVVGMMVAMIVVMILAGILAALKITAAAVIVGVAGWFAIIGVMIWLLARFCMALPLCFVERRFALFESWEFTRGYTGSLVTVGLLVFGGLYVTELVLMAVVTVGVFAAWPGLLHDPSAVGAFFAQPFPVVAAALAPWIALWVVVAAVLGATASAIVLAPLAEIYKTIAVDHRVDPGVAGLSLTL
jgi:hypothetical protein